MWFLSPLLYSLAVASSAAAATAAGLSAFYAGSNWNTWREHFSAELVGGQVTLEPSESRDTLVNLLAGADTQIRCLMQGCEHNFHTVLQLVDHINISHPDHCAFAGQHQDVKLCPCGKVFMDTAYGRRCHASWCEHIRISLLSPPPSSPASVQILELSNRCRASVDNRMVYLADLTLHAYEWGASFGGDTNICYYLSTTAPDSMPDTCGVAVSQQHGESAIARKAMLAVLAKPICSEDFAMRGKCADNPVLVADTLSHGPIGVADLNYNPPKFLVSCTKDCDANTPVRLLARIGAHFQRLYTHDGKAVRLGTLLALRTEHTPVTSSPVPSPCPVQQVLDWCDSLLVRFRAASPGHQEQPTQPSEAPSPSQSDPHEARLTPDAMASHNRL